MRSSTIHPRKTGEARRLAPTLWLRREHEHDPHRPREQLRAGRLALDRAALKTRVPQNDLWRVAPEDLAEAKDDAVREVHP